MRSLILATAVILCGCASRQTSAWRDYQSPVLIQETQEQVIAPRVSYWLYTGTTAGAHHLVYRKADDDGRSIDFKTQVSASKVAIPDPLPMTRDESQWRLQKSVAE